MHTSKTKFHAFSILGIKLIKRPTTFLGTAAFATAVVGAIALGVWSLHALLERFLADGHEVCIENLHILPERFLSVDVHFLDGGLQNVDSRHIESVNIGDNNVFRSSR